MLGKLKKRGFTLIAVNEVDQERLKAEQQRTRVMAGEIAVFQKALNSYISYHRGSVTATNTPAELSGVKRGINWLNQAKTVRVGQAGGTSIIRFSGSHLPRHSHVQNIPIDRDGSQNLYGAVPTNGRDEKFIRYGNTETTGASGLYYYVPPFFAVNMWHRRS